MNAQPWIGDHLGTEGTKVYLSFASQPWPNPFLPHYPAIGSEHLTLSSKTSSPNQLRQDFGVAAQGTIKFQVRLLTPTLLAGVYAYYRQWDTSAGTREQNQVSNGKNIWLCNFVDFDPKPWGTLVERYQASFEFRVISYVGADS